MTWNYRLILMDITYPTQKWYKVHEVYYKHNKPYAWSKEVVKIEGEDQLEVMQNLLLIRLDIQRYPILKESKMPKPKSRKRKPGEE